MKITKFFKFGLPIFMVFGLFAGIATATNVKSAKATGEPNVFYVEDSFEYCAEANVQAGQLSYWNQDWNPIAEVTPSYDYSNGQYTIEYSNNIGDWWSVQAFCKLLGTSIGKTYEIKLTLESDKTGQMTVNGSAVSLVAGTPYDHTFQQTFGSETVLSMQLGVDGVGILASSGTFTFTVEYIHDISEPLADYRTVTFKNNDTVIKQADVVSGTTLSFAPNSPTPAEGYTFDGWYTDEDVKWTNSTVITADTTYFARFTNNTHTVEFYNDAIKLGEVVVADGATTSSPDYAGDFGNVFNRWYTNQALTQAFDFATPIESDLVLYGATSVVPSETWLNSGSLDGYASNDANGYYKITNYPSLKGTNWHIQVNFTTFGTYIADPSVKHTVRFMYKINQEGGDANLVNGGETRKTLLVSDSYLECSFDFTGTPTKLSIELGAVTGDTFSFSISQIILEEFTEKQVTAVTLPATATVGIGSNYVLEAVTSGTLFSLAEWESDDTSVATVSGDTLSATITGVAAGTATISVSVTSTTGTFNASCEVTVNEPITMKVYFAVKNGFGNLGNNLAILSHGSVSLTNTPASNTNFSFTYGGNAGKLYLATLNLTQLGVVNNEGVVKDNSWVQLGNTTNGAFGQSYHYTNSDVANGLFLTLENFAEGSSAITKVGTATDVEAVIEYCRDSLKSDTIDLDDDNYRTEDCTANFTNAMSELELLTNAQRKILKGTDYYSRLQAWAVANETTVVIADDGTISSNVGLNPIQIDNSALIIVIIAFSTMSLISIGFIFFRKRQHN